MDMKIPALRINILLESNPSKSRILVWRFAVLFARKDSKDLSDICPDAQSRQSDFGKPAPRAADLSRDPAARRQHRRRRNSYSTWSTFELCRRRFEFNAAFRFPTRASTRLVQCRRVQ